MPHFAYRLGTVFGVPLKDGGYGVGVVARVCPRGGVILAYLFPWRFANVPRSADFGEIDPASAIRVIMSGDLGIISGEWPVLGEIGIDHFHWPMPEFVRHEPVSNRAFKVSYADGDPGMIIEEIRIGPDEAQALPKDGLHGAGAVERLMSQLLGGPTLHRAD